MPRAAQKTPKDDRKRALYVRISDQAYERLKLISTRRRKRMATVIEELLRQLKP